MNTFKVTEIVGHRMKYTAHYNGKTIEDECGSYVYDAEKKSLKAGYRKFDNIEVLA